MTPKIEKQLKEFKQCSKRHGAQIDQRRLTDAFRMVGLKYFKNS